MTQEWPFPIEDTDDSAVVLKESLPEAIESVATEFAGATEPSPTFAYQRWIDTANGLVKQRNAANSAWVVVRKLFADAQQITSTVFIGTVTASVSGLCLMVTDKPLKILEAYVVSTTGTTSDGSNKWDIMVRNHTDGEDLLSAAFSTDGDDIGAKTPKALGLNQNQTIAGAGRYIELNLALTGSPGNLTDLAVTLVLSGAV